jgi:hypothetical protein
MSEDPSGRSALNDASWIDALSDEECMEIFWLYVDPPEPFLEAHPPQLLGAAMRYALRALVESASRKGG